MFTGLKMQSSSEKGALNGVKIPPTIPKVEVFGNNKQSGLAMIVKVGVLGHIISPTNTLIYIDILNI